MKKNITIICLSNEYKKNIAKQLALELDMFYADINDIMEYNLINSEMLEKAGQQYYDENEAKTIKTVSGYDDTILTLNLSTLNKSNYLDIIKQNSLIIYIRLDFETFMNLNKAENSKALVKINEIAFDDRDKLISNFADIIVENKYIDVTRTIKQIIEGIEKFFYKKN